MLELEETPFVKNVIKIIKDPSVIFDGEVFGSIEMGENEIRFQAHKDARYPIGARVEFALVKDDKFCDMFPNEFFMNYIDPGNDEEEDYHAEDIVLL
jgi:hypothetical protein